MLSVWNPFTDRMELQHQRCDLLTQERSWDDRILSENFAPMDAAAIRRIPLGRANEDFWAWAGEKHGLYSVRSAYRMLANDAHQEDDHSQNIPASSGANNSWIWKKLWRSKVPPKVRVFGRRVSNEFIPSRANLHRRHVEQLSTCISCGNEPETTFHALTQCSYARQFWRSLSDLTGVKLPVLHPATWTADLLDDKVCDERDRCIILCGIWSVWGSRNDRKHGKSPIPLKLDVD
jgi:hypothetical protein